jgi:hypothetical protein
MSQAELVQLTHGERHPGQSQVKRLYFKVQRFVV